MVHGAEGFKTTLLLHQGSGVSAILCTLERLKGEAPRSMMTFQSLVRKLRRWKRTLRGGGQHWRQKVSRSRSK